MLKVLIISITESADVRKCLWPILNYFIDVCRLVARTLIKIWNVDYSLKFKVLMAFQCSIVFATKYVNITVLVLNIVADTIFLRVLQIQVQSHHIHHLTQVLILHVSNWWY
jgi:hypothetical protein